MSDKLVADGFADPETVRNPYAFYDTLRDEAPVFYSPTVRGYVVSRFEDVREVLSNDKIFSSSPRIEQIGAMAKFSEAYFHLYEEAGTPPPLAALVVADGEFHTRHRKLIDKWFNAPAVRQLDNSIVEIIRKLIADFIELGKADLYRDFCMKLPLFVICDMLGIPRSNAELMQRSGDAQARLASGGAEDEQGRIECHRAVVAFQKFMQPYIDDRRKNPTDDLLSHLVNAPTLEGDTLTEREIHSLVQNLNAGGTETTTNGLGNMFGLMLEHSEIQEELRADASMIPRFIEEVIRLESPVAGMPRWANVDTEIDGVQIPANSMIFARIGAANRDNRKFECPAKVDATRSGIRNHVGFGAGIHYCLGAVLSRFELKVAMEELLARTKNLQFDPDAPPAMRSEKIQTRAWKNLPVVFEKVDQ